MTDISELFSTKDARAGIEKKIASFRIYSGKTGSRFIQEKLVAVPKGVPLFYGELGSPMDPPSQLRLQMPVMRMVIRFIVIQSMNETKPQSYRCN